MFVLYVCSCLFLCVFLYVFLEYFYVYASVVNYEAHVQNQQ